MEEIVKELIKIVPVWFIMICIIFIGLRYGLKHIFDCIKELLIRFDTKERERQSRYNEIYRNYQEAVNNNTKAFIEFKEKTIYFENEIKEEIGEVKKILNNQSIK